VAPGLLWVLAAEVLASALGFAALLHLARRLGPASFARFEYAAVVLTWLLVLVRGGVDVIVYREAARRPRLIGPLSELLIGLRCVAAAFGYVLILCIAAMVGQDRGTALAVAGLGLFAGAWVTDVGPRATGRLAWVALAQGTRAVGFLAAVVAVIRRPADALLAAACLVLGEVLGAAVPLILHAREHGFPRPRFRRRASLVLARRAAIAGVTRFGRVTLYGADVLALGSWAGSELGQYVAARRLVFALVALGLVVPASLGPWIARAWAEGPEVARQRISAILAGLWSASLPVAVIASLSAGRSMPWLFGPSYREGAPWLALIAARLPWLLVATSAQTALVACRQEASCFRLVAGQVGVAAVLIPAALLSWGPWGAGWAACLVEVVGAIGGWALLSRISAAPSWREQAGPALAGTLALALACRTGRSAPLSLACLAAVFAHGLDWRAAWRLAGRRWDAGRVGT
jgi:O-antigen/teichoic acid export membrane protein